ncbi:hypothetical protein ACTXM3_18015 [Glutamicibacter arilaitensis]|uniref:DNA-binding protein n=1 Tax=Glutamicibacter arilaitensis TaxID=256701 RepID=A0A2N7RXA9_9MICC|nr:hypothetical protein [Glutamicibacter arilaitensis]PMQ18521.1 hypothetical protein CIK84_18930 [Glutamicibacter arilaitensis]
MEFTDEDKQSALATVHDLAKLRHALTSMAEDVRRLLEQAERSAAAHDVPPSLIAKAAGVTKGRMTQLLARPDTLDLIGVQIHKKAHQLTQYPQDALSAHKADFPGEMTFPPYPQPRKRTGRAENQPA